MSRIRDTVHAILSTAYLEFAGPDRGMAGELDASGNINHIDLTFELPSVVT